MKPSPPVRPARSRHLTIVHGILMIVVLIVVVQLWLFTATMDAYLGGSDAIVIPAAIASAVCLGLNVGLLWYLRRLA